ncbi:unnamed protein product [Cercopithifilaria johnstoni]|uniref:Chitin-binding type-2 domain-containing protein n=1 Tax=Cercopithifilaria johnstoni TaxID=2874296 RepID=A0A8J2LZ07_9BILA|nr:unnamed protein product [Cercopithifilaria johnstoni]
MEIIPRLKDNAPRISGIAQMVKLSEEFVEMIYFSMKSLIIHSDIGSNCIALNESVVKHSACSQFYYSCKDGQLLQLQCPEGQAYDVRQKQCDNMTFLPECATTENSSLLAAGNPLLISNVILAPELDCFCNTTGDGLFSAGCENYFYSCASGHGYRMKCPEGLFFDSETLVCNYKEHVPLCNLASKDSKTMANEEAYAYTTATKSVDQDESKEAKPKKVTDNHSNQVPDDNLPALVSVPISNRKSLPILPKDFDCRSKADSFYSIGCKTEFVACANRRTFFFECPHNLIFNEKEQMCDYAENVEGCSEMGNINEKGSFLTTSAEMEQEEEETKRDGAAVIRDQGQIIDPVSKTCNELENIPECMDKNARMFEVSSY